MGKKKQNKRKKKPAARAAPQTKQEVQDELIALEAVFADDFIVHNDKKGFDLNVLPYPSKAEINHVSVKLSVRFGDCYPDGAPTISLQQIYEGTEEQLDDLLEQLNNLASEFAKTSDVFMFSLIDHCQEAILEWNAQIASGIKQTVRSFKRWTGCSSPVGYRAY